MTILSNYNGDIDCWRKMQFNSVKSGSFSGLAGHVNKVMDQALKAGRDTAVDHTAIAKESIKGRSLERRAAMKADAKVSRAGLDAIATVKQVSDNVDAAKNIEDIKRPARRMAGVVGALGTLSGAYVLGQTAKKDKAAHDEYIKKFDERTQAIEAAFNRGSNVQLETIPDAIPFETPELQPIPGGNSGNGGGAQSSNSSGGGSQKITYQSSPLAGSADVAKLTSDDFNHLAYAISSEAGPGKDRYGVAASILNRVKSDKWPGTVKDVIYQDGQYEGVYKGLSRNSPDIAKDLASPQGRTEIIKALEVLDGRTDFKGQTMLKYRSNKGNKGGIMDPMFDPKGNFFHYSHQT